MEIQKFEIKIYKSQKKLELWKNSELVGEYPIGIGKVEEGHKKLEGDFKTPEGKYRVCVKNPKSKFYLSLGINYPNNEDAHSALSDERITQEEFDKICAANDGFEIPPWKTKMGGEVYIHGELEKCQWSEGCIRLFNKDMKALFDLIEVNTPVSIFP